MRSIVLDYLTDALRAIESDTSGTRADYIPELAIAAPDRLWAVLPSSSSSDAETVEVVTALTASTSKVRLEG